MSDREEAVLRFLREAATATGNGTASASIRRIGAALGVAPGSIQQTLVRLEKRGAIERVPSEGRVTMWKIAA